MATRKSLSRKARRKSEGFNGTLVEVFWYDATSNDSWREKEEVAQGKRRKQPSSELIYCHTAGILVYEDKKQICITDTETNSGSVRGTFTIPKPWIKKVIRK